MDLDTWNTIADPQRLLALVSKHATDRQCRLLAASCAFRIDDHGGYDAEAIIAIRVAMLHADGLMSLDDLAESKRIALESMDDYTFTAEAKRFCVDAVTEADSGATLGVFDGLSQYYDANFEAHETEQEWSYHASTVRDVIRPPGAQPIAETALPPHVAGLAARFYNSLAVQIHEDRSGTPTIGELIAALESASVALEILDHFRSHRRHVRGCWALDHLLGHN